MKREGSVNFGTVTLLVNVQGLGGATPGAGIFSPLVLTGTIVSHTEIPRGHDTILFPKKIEVDGKITEKETFLCLRVNSAIMPPGFPLTIADLQAADVAINLDYIIMILPVAAD